MATYFDAKNDNHLKLLPPSLRKAEDVADLATIVEADVIAVYTDPFNNEDFTLRETIRSSEEQGDFEFVHLAGYKLDADDVDTDPGLLLALRRTIAEVIRWRAAQWKREMGVASESDDRGKNRTYTLDAHSTNFPPGWDRWLDKFDTREPPWGA